MNMISATRLMQFSHHFHKFYAQQFLALMEETGFSMREFHVLLFLINNPAYDTARDISELRGLVKSQVSQAVELLSAQGLLLRTPDTADRRVVHLKLTESGRTLGQRAQEVQSACYRRLLDGFSPEEDAQFRSLLERVMDNCTALETHS